MIRNDVGTRAAIEDSDVARRRTENCLQATDTAECPAGCRAASRWPTRQASGYAECAARPSVGDDQPHGSFVPTAMRLSVGSPLIRTALRARAVIVCRLRAFAAELFVNGEQKPDRHSCRAQTFRCEDLRRDDPFRVARSAPVNVFVVLTRRDERRHRVHVRREDNARRRVCRGQNVETSWSNIFAPQLGNANLRGRLLKTLPHLLRHR